MKGKFILVLGGSRSGKSEYAEELAERSGKRITYIATAAVHDDEMAERVKLHQERRPQNWLTVEAEKNVLDVLSQGGEGDAFLLDCATLWLTNLLLDQQNSKMIIAPSEKETQILEQVARLSETVENGADLIVVSNEVGLGLIPEHPMGRVFRDLAGKANQLMASRADSVYLLVAGIPMEIKNQRQ
jgi:adenosylcobinamide kinase/adenosylcobinamide-phosphate guanylyltransferase